MTDIQNQVVVDSLHAEVETVLSKLSAREYGILRMRYGLDDGKPKTLEDVGKTFKVSNTFFTPRISLCHTLSL